MINRDEYFKLLPYVRLVQGVYRDALYNFYSNQILPIPKTTSSILTSCDLNPIIDVINGIADPENQVTVIDYINKLENWGFGHRISEEVRELNIIEEISEYKQNKLNYMSLDLRTTSAVIDWLGIIEYSRKKLMCRQLCIFLSGAVEVQEFEYKIVSWASQMEYHHVEVVFETSRLPDYWAERLRSLKVWVGLNTSSIELDDNLTSLIDDGLKFRPSPLNSEPPKIRPSLFKCNIFVFRLLKSGSIHSNSIHIDPMGNLYLWVLEKHHRLGTIQTPEDFAFAIGGPGVRKAWRLNKDNNEYCGKCEFRYGCENSYTFRLDPNNISSRPGNCTYSPEDGVWNS